MNKKVLILIFVISSIIPVYGQMQSQFLPSLHKKPALDTSVLSNGFSYQIDPGISDLGHYVAFNNVNLENQNWVVNRLVVKSTSDSWYRQFYCKEGGNYLFSRDERKFIYKSDDSLYFAELGSNQQQVVVNVKSWGQNNKVSGEWMGYLSFGQERRFQLVNLLTNKETSFYNVSDYLFELSGKQLLLMTEHRQNDSTEASLILVELSQNKMDIIWHFHDSSHKMPVVTGYQFDNTGAQLVFVVKQEYKDQNENEIWYYKLGMDRAVDKLNNQSPEIGQNLKLSDNPTFTPNGKFILFNLDSATKVLKVQPEKIGVDVWSYKDLILQPDQAQHLVVHGDSIAQQQITFLACIKVDNNLIIRIEKAGEQLMPGLVISGNYAVVRDNKDVLDYWWKFNPQSSFFLVSLKTGARIMLKSHIGKDIFGRDILINFSFSPFDRYLMYWDCEKASYINYEIETGRFYNISKIIPTKITPDYFTAVYKNPVASVVGWEKNGTSVLLYDNYDIWQIHISDHPNSTNITGGYGRKHHVKLNLVYGPGATIGDYSSSVYENNDTLLLSGFDMQTKYNGFYNIVLGQNRAPKMLTMGPFTYFRTQSQMEVNDYGGMQPVKAMGCNCYLIQRESGSEAPNYFFTKDFKQFAALTHLNLYKKYNWLTSELITWKQLDGSLAQGILYKPENFDPRKKYPIIFNYYEKRSQRLFNFLSAGYTSSDIDIPWFVSNGYLVCTPDIYYKIATQSGKVAGEDAYNSVISAAKYLSKFPFVNSKKMAIQGHSFGAFETNYLVTHSNLFTAAAEAAGTTDPISSYLTLIPLDYPVEHFQIQTVTEMNHEFYASSPWQRPDLYRHASAVLNADKVVTPLLIMHNIHDNQIQWRQGVELFMALRRLSKRVWLLQYDDGDHTADGSCAVDYTIRLTQFFDHYLKDMPAPVWMTKGVPAYLKHVDLGYTIDTDGTCNPDCPICKKMKIR